MAAHGRRDAAFARTVHADVLVIALGDRGRARPSSSACRWRWGRSWRAWWWGSPVSHQAAADALPLRDAFAVLFFVSVGMLFDPAFLVRTPMLVVAALAIVLVGKPLAAIAIVAILGYPTRTALMVAVGLAQIGEFSFILGDLARKHGLLPDAGHTLLIACAIVSISVNPLLFGTLDSVEAFLRRRPTLWRLLNAAADRRGRTLNGATAAAAREHAATPCPHRGIWPRGSGRGPGAP